MVSTPTGITIGGIPVNASSSSVSPSAGFSINVQDTKGNLIEDANVEVWNESNTVQFTYGRTNAKGCFSGTMPIEKIGIIYVSHPYYQAYTEKIIIVPLTLINNPLKNFIFLVVDSANIPVIGATVEIKSDIHIDNGVTGMYGSYEGRIESSYENTLKIINGASTYTRKFNSFTPISCLSSSHVVVNIIEVG